MSDSRLYYKIKLLSNDKVKFYYHAAVFNDNVYTLKSNTKCVDKKDMLLVSNVDSIQSLLNIMNKTEFSRFSAEFKKTKDSAQKLSQMNSSANNLIITKLWAQRELHTKFTKWFSDNGSLAQKNFYLINKEQMPAPPIQSI